MLIKNIKTVLIILLFFCSIIYAKEKKYNEKTYIRNEEEAKAAYSLALFYKERALASKIPTEESIEDLEKAKVILEEVLKYINNNEINITLAETHEALGEYDESSAIYDKLISENPDDVYLLIKAAERNIFLMGDYGKAKYYLDSAYEIDSFNNDILILLGFIYYSERDFEKAVLYFEKVEQSKGASNNYMQYYNYYYGMSEFYLSRFKKALNRLKKVNIKGLNPVDRYNTLYGIIKSYQALENYKEAYSNSLSTKDAPELSLFLSFMADDYNEELFSEAETIDMSDAPKILSIILTAKNEGYSNALKIIETGLDRRDIDLDIIQTYYKLINEVGDIEDKINSEMDTISFYVALKNIDALPNHIDKLIEYDKTEKFNNLYLQAAAEFRNQNDFESAKEMLNKYISLTNKAILENELVSLVLTAIDIKEYDLALNSINKFEKEKYSYSYLRAYVNLHKNEIEKANQFLNEDLIYFRNDKSNTNEYRLNIPYITAMSVSNSNSVMEYVNFIYSSNTNSANNINSMAWVLVYLEIDIDRGIELAKNAVKKESKSPHYLDTLGFGYYKKKNYDSALKQLLKAALYVDDNSKAEIYLHIADAYYDKNDLKNALKYYRKSISSLYKDFIFINFEEDRIKKRIEFINNKLKN